MRELLKVNIGETIKEYKAGSSFYDVVKDFYGEDRKDVLLVKSNGRLRELSHQLEADSKLELITLKDKIGVQAYERTAVFIMLKAFYDIVGKKNISKICVEFSTGNGLFIRANGDFVLDEELIENIKQAMHALIKSSIPIIKKNIDTESAIELFRKHEMFDKEKLFNYRRSSKVNIYSLAGFEDYFYGYMLYDTSYVEIFDLLPYEDGLILMLPKNADRTLPEFKPSFKVFKKLHEATEWANSLNLSTVGDLNEHISLGRAADIILMSEAMMEKNIADIASNICCRDGVRFVMIAGPSSSGKTTFSHRLSIQLRANGLNPHPIEVDNYFKNREDTPKDADGNYNFESLYAIDLEAFNKDMSSLLSGERVELPKFNFKTGKREYNGDFLELKEGDILIIEGIHCLNDKMSESLPKESKYKIYISALTQLNTDEHNRIHTTDGRLLRRMVRDARTRGTSAERTLDMWASVRRGEEENIFPFQDMADDVFNSSMIYELAVIKPYAEALLFGIKRDSKQYLEAKRLLKFLDYFLCLPSDLIPNNSIIREFISGSCFHV